MAPQVWLRVGKNRQSTHKHAVAQFVCAIGGIILFEGSRILLNFSVS